MFFCRGKVREQFLSQEHRSCHRTGRSASDTLQASNTHSALFCWLLTDHWEGYLRPVTRRNVCGLHTNTKTCFCGKRERFWSYFCFPAAVDKQDRPYVNFDLKCTLRVHFFKNVVRLVDIGWSQPLSCTSFAKHDIPRHEVPRRLPQHLWTQFFARTRFCNSFCR